MVFVALRSLIAHKLRLALTAVAVILGVAFMSATFIVTDTIDHTFSSIITSATSGTSVLVRGTPLAGGDASQAQTERHYIEQSTLATVRSVPGVAAAYGVVSNQNVAVLDRSGTPIINGGAPPIGTNWIPPPASPFRLIAGHAPQADDEVAVDQTTASRHNLNPGDSVTIVFNGGTEGRFTVAGVVGYGTAASLGGATITAFTTHEALGFAEPPNTYQTISVVAASGVSDSTLAGRIGRALPSTAEALSASSAAEQLTQQVNSIIQTFIGTPLLVFACIALFVSSFLIVNTFTILITQRARELALLRALGATRRQVLFSVLIETAATGVVASILGSLVGILLAAGLRSLLSGVGFDLPGGLTLTARSFATAIAAGTAVTVIAGVIPARRAMRLAPVEALREAQPEPPGITRRRVAAGLALTAIGVVLFLIGLAGKTSTPLQLVGGGAFMVFIGVAYLSPLLVRPIARAAGAPVSRIRGVPGQMARENAMRSPRRTASTAAALMIGVALVVAMAILANSAEASVTADTVGTINAAFIIVPAQNGGQRSFSPAAATALRHNASLADVSEARADYLVANGSSQSLLGIDTASLSRTLNLDMTSGTAMSLTTPGTVLIDSKTAAAQGVSTGDVITAQYPNAPATTRLPVGGIYKPNGLVSGYVVSLDTYARAFPVQQDFAIVANPAPGVSAGDAEKAMDDTLRAFPTLVGETRDAYAKSQAQQISQFASFIYVLLALSIVIAFVGIVNTLTLSIVERTRELGLLRALGLTRRQMRSMVRWESVIIAVIGAVLGLVVGTGLGSAVVKALTPDAFSGVFIPAGPLVLSLAAAVALGGLAAVWPAWRSGKLDILAAISTE